MRTARQLAHTMRRLSLTGWLTTAGVLFGLTVLEFIGRGFTSDAMDGAVLVLMVSLLVRARNAGVRKAARVVLGAAWKLLLRWSIDLGIDFTGHTNIPRGFPGLWLATLGVAGGATALLATVYNQVPGDLRALLAPRCYLLYLALVALLWATLGAGMLVHATLGWLRLHDWMVVRNQQRRGPAMRHELPLTMALWGMAVTAALLLPAGFSLLIHAALLAVAGAAFFACSSGLDMLWSDKHGGPLRSMDGRWVILMQCGLSILISASLILVTNGDALSIPVDGLAKATGFIQRPTVITSILGHIFAWFSVVGNLVFVNMIVRIAAMGIRFNPARMERQLKTTQQHWTSQERRHFEIQCRRELIRRLKTLFHHVAQQKARRGGTGVILGLQHWYVWGLSWDTDDHPVEDDNTVLEDVAGLPFHLVFSREARFHYWQLTRALQIDLIYVEHGISYRQLVGVLRVMFETYDVFGGRQRAEERHFSGLPKVRVILHDHDVTFAPEHGRTSYPEPKYHEISRARILHIFKDRGDDSELDLVPDSWEGVPVASGV